MQSNDLAMKIWPAPTAQAAADWLFSDDGQPPPVGEVVEYSPLTRAQYHADELVLELERMTNKYERLRKTEGMLDRPSLTQDAWTLIKKIRGI